MCGIGGIIRYGDVPINPDCLALMLIGNEHRGMDATGIAISQADGSIDFLKDDEPAWQFVTREEYKTFLKNNLREDSWAVLLHTRAATTGTPRVNKNNHPLTNGKATIIHNGVIHNDTMLFDNMKLERGAETDSDIIRAIVDKDGITPETLVTLNRISGSAAGAALHPEYPKRLILFRSGSPLCLASNDDFLVFASEKNTIHRSMRTWTKRFGGWFQSLRPDLDFAPMADDTSLILDDTGIIHRHQFRALTSKYVEPHRQVFRGYKERQARWDREVPKAKTVLPMLPAAKREGWCVDCKRMWVLAGTSTNPEDYTCPKDGGGCGKSLVAKVVMQVN